jgi:subtilisin-like proprotein convertase family protein
MRWRPLTWFLLSVFFFVAAAFFWRLGDEWAAKKTAPSVGQATNQPQSPGALAKPRAQAAPIHLLTQPGNLNASVPAPSTNSNRVDRFAHRLSNTTKPLGELIRNDKAILLQNALIDTAQNTPLPVPQHLRAQGDPGSYIVQLHGPLDNAFFAALNQAGATFVSYIPNNAALVLGSAAVAQKLAADSRTQAVLPFEPYYKLEPSLLGLAVTQQPLPEHSTLNLLLFPGARENIAAELPALQVEILHEDRSPFGPVLGVQVPASADILPALAGLPGVQAIEYLRVRVPANDLSRATIGVSSDSVTTNNYLGLTGSNILVNVNDTGIDASHPDFAPSPGVRILGNSAASLTDVNGHGTHVAGIIGGSGAVSTNVNNALGSIMPGTNFQFRGKAPASQLFVIAFDPDSGPFLPDTYLQETPARTNAFISNNSWNYGGQDAQAYDIAAASFDAAVRDALPRVTGSQPVLFVFSAGNNGSGDDTGTGGQLDSIQSPATAKNVITVGALEQPRNITNVVVVNCTTTIVGGTNVTTCQTNTPWALMTDASDQVAGYSSRGNVGVGVEGDFGRFKPDVVAPGTFVISTRSKQWNEAAYYARHITTIYRDVVLAPNALLSDNVFIADNATSFSLTALPNASSPSPFPGVPIYVSKTTFPTPASFDFAGTNQLTISLPQLNPLDQTWYFAAGNSSGQTLQFDFRTDITYTNTGDDIFFQVLSNINGGQGITYTNTAIETNTATHYYRYESGTSMAAGDASGALALMQDMLQNRLGHKDAAGHFTNSPALLKAMLINGARSAGNLYDFNVTNTLNFQGWGLLNVSNSLHGGLAATTATTNSMFLFDQSPTHALATGQSHRRNIQVSPDGQGQALRFTLVWTDPPGNPIASTKLVNDLDLVVTNLDTGDVFFGNDILPGNDFNVAWDTNGPPTQDSINNVENVFLQSPVGSQYAVVVMGRHVNVNAVTANPDNVAQDYALVISSGEGALTNALSLGDETDISVTAPFVTVVTNTFGSDNPQNFGAILSHQHAGASTPLLGTNQVALPTDANAEITLGMTNQWHFYLLSNTNSPDFTNAAFATFSPPNLALPVMGAREGEEGTNSSRAEADLDLYVSRDPNLTNLSPQAIDGAYKSLSRGGTETIILSNATPGDYYIGVKSEDQRAADYSFVAILSSLPFGNSASNGNALVRGIPAPATIPDATSLGATTRPVPGATTVIAFAPNPSILLHRVIVTNTITHQLMSDLFGSLTHEGGQQFAVLNNGSLDFAVTNAAFIYDDSSQHDIPGSQHTDGPGSLHDFAGQHAGTQWRLTMVDNKPDHVGTNMSLWIYLEKQQDLTNGLTVNINPNSCREDFIEVPADATNLTVSVGVLSGTGPLSFQVCPVVNGGLGQCKSNYIAGAGSVISIDLNDVPPLQGGEYVVRLCNLGGSVVQVHILARIDIGVGVPVLRNFTLTNVVPILDDAVTTITNFVNSHFEIASLDVGLLLNHPRVSDLAITLISPSGTRILLTESRGALYTGGLGTFNLMTNSEGLPVYAVTNMVPYYTNDFEDAPVGVYRPGATFEHWNVLNNSIAIVRDLNELCRDDNVVVLGQGVISNTLPTTNSTSYQLSFRVTHSPYLIGTVAWWPFDVDAADIFGGHDGLLCGNPQFVPGEVNGSFLGDGVASSITVPACPELDLGTRPGFTIEGWINPANITNPAPLVEWNDLTSTNVPTVGLQFWLSGNFTPAGGPGSLSLNFWDVNSQPHAVDTPALTVTNALSPTKSAWQHVALTFNAASLTAKFYVNGNLVQTTPLPGPAFVPRTTGDLYFGYHAATALTNTVAFQGGLDEFGFYERALCDCEIAAIAHAGSRGKYDTNVLICPVITKVQLPGILTTNFFNGLHWNVTGPQWEVNTINFTNSLLTAGTNGPVTNLAPIVIQSLGCPGAALDDFVLSSLVTNFFDGLLHFTDDTNLAPVPIKFAPTPYIVTNFPPVLVFTNGFENALPGVTNPGAILAGSSNSPAIGQRNWTVDNSPVTVLTNADGEAISSNFVALAAGAVECQLPVIPGHRYQINYSVRGPCAAGWWNGDLDSLSQRAIDLIGGNDGAFINGATNSAINVVGADSLFLPGMLSHGSNGVPDIAGKVELGDPDNLKFTNSFSIEGWIQPLFQTNAYINALRVASEEGVIEQIFFRGDSRYCLDPYYFALEQSSFNKFALLFHIGGENSGDCGMTIEAESVVTASVWQHVAAVFESNVAWTNNPPWPTNQLRLYVNGQLATNLILHPGLETGTDGFTSLSPFRDLDPGFSPGVAIGNRSRAEASEPFRGYIDELTVYDRALTGPEVAAIASTGTFGKADPAAPPVLSLAKVSAQIDGVQQDVGYGDNSTWTAHSFTFTALRTNAVLSLQSLLPGSQVDAITMFELPAELNYQPEEPLSQLNGQDAYGEWRLEIWDNRVGATNDLTQLVDWQLAFHLAPSNPPPVVSLSHCVPYVSTLGPGAIQFFVVEAPQWATMATNILAFANARFTTNPAPVTVLFNQTNFPGAADLALIGPLVSGGSFLLASNTVPPFIAGQAYFLALTNPNPVAVDFSLAVCFDVTTLANCQPTTNFVGTAGIPRYFQFDVPTNAVPPGASPLEATLWLTGANTNLTVVLSEHLPLPDLGQHDYISAQPCTNDEIVFVVTNSTPFPIQTNRWYVGVFNSAATNVPFTIQSCWSTNNPTLIPLTNGVPYVAGLASPYIAPPGPPRFFFYEFSVTNYVDSMLFELYNLAGDADLVLQRDVPPGMAPYFDGSFRTGTDPEQIVVRASFNLPDLRGNWFLGVYNNESTNVAYTIRAVTSTNGLLISALPLNMTLTPLTPPRGNLIQWNGVVGEHYYIQTSTTLFPPAWTIVGTNVATTPCPTFELPAGTGGFVQVLQFAPPSVLPQLMIQRWPGNLVRISWPTTSFGFTLQYSTSLTGPWATLQVPVAIEGSEFVVYDTVGAIPKFYRLIR